ncbi:MAG TPA: hypothetical protein VGL89_16065 [Candidatus Koribacter sp.]|jgi:hypothetical protein
MPAWAPIGRIIFAIAILYFAMVHVLSALTLGPQPSFPWMPAPKLVLAVIAILLLACGAGIFANRYLQPSCIVLAAFLAVYILSFYIAFIAQDPHDPTRFAGASELASMAAAALLLAFPASMSKRAPALTARIVLALAMVNFGAVHFLLPKFIGPLVPSWIPGHLFFTYFLGGAFLAAALSFATGIQVRLAGLLLGIMFLIFFVTVHIPRITHAAHSLDEWTSGVVAFAMIGISWVASESATVRATTTPDK